MNKKISSHPALLHAEDIKTLCQPLISLDITYFSHVHVDEMSGLSGFSNHPAFHEHYLKMRYYNADISAAAFDFGNHILWDCMPLKGKSANLYAESIAFGIKHTFTVVHKSSNTTDYFHFATDHANETINHAYLRNLDLLNLFIQSYRCHAYQFDYIKKIHRAKFYIDDNGAQFDLNQNAKSQVNDLKRQQFLEECRLEIMTKHHNKLTRREIEILIWLHHGKSCTEIASILGLAEITIHKHIANLKEKHQSYTFFQLGEHFRELFGDATDIISKLADK